MDLLYCYYIFHSLRSRLLPSSLSNFAGQTLSRYQEVYGWTDEFRSDQNLPRGRSVYWRLVHAQEREKYFQERAACFIARGLLGNSLFMLEWYFFALMTWIGLGHSLPCSLIYLRQLLQNVL